MARTPILFRIGLEVSDIDEAAAFYARLLRSKGRRIHESRHYFDCGPVILGLLIPGHGRRKAKPIPDLVYFAVRDLEAVFARARRLGCLANDEFHGQRAGRIEARPWGERSFYAVDPWGNGLCFVDAATLFTGRR